MKKIWLLILSLFTLSCIWNLTQANDYEYTSLNITANILNDGTINVDEDFTANFFVSKHWIIRDIPLNYSVWWKDFHIEVSNIGVQWKNFTTSKNNGDIEIKIWDADRTVIWKQNYPISYSTYGLIRNFSWMWYAELYWNLVGYDFDTKINKVRAELILPKIYTWFTAYDFLITTDWKSKTIDWFEWTVDWSQWDRIIITYNKWLSAYHGITLAVKFPNNYFKFDHERQAELIWFYKENPIVKLWKWITNFIRDYFWFWEWSFITLFLFGLLLEIPRRIKEKKNLSKYPTIIQYSAPKELNCAEVWFLYHRHVKTSQIISLIYKWASDWIISLKNTGEKICITKNKELEFDKNSGNSFYSKNSDLEKLFNNNESIKDSDIAWENQHLKNHDYENHIFKNLFKDGKKIYIPNKHLNLNLPWLEKYFWLYCWEKNWIKSNLSSDYTSVNTIIMAPIWRLYVIMFVIILFISLSNESPYLCLRSFFWWILSIILWGILYKPALTEEWYKLLSEIKWYRKFIKSCDEKQIREFLKQDNLFFDKTLPYAVALWLETEFMKNFKPIMEEMGISQNWCTWDLTDIIHFVNDWIHIESQSTSSGSSSSSSYSSSGWFSGGSSFGWWGSSFSSGWGGWWWGWRSW